ncbi:ABC transporter permease [Streptomyces sp. NBC_00878]|uniref:ABC transporter permease n=1 Tax=Streptomyces sp. NBC_00878 TaxID=2975854 RepID=UPI002257F9B8|nr:ABC transporter permease [Streptomyces sp. NBC_00878]MCX4902899.1 ABC transporter permease [Streptomyces sp. NBC_00878]
MSNLTMTSAVGPDRPATPPAPSTAARGLRLRGLTWLIWRQHRAGYWTIIAATVFTVALITYERSGLVDSLTATGWPDGSPDKWALAAQAYATRFQMVSYGLGFIPILLGVFLGAPLLAGDLESGTAKLVGSQSVRPSRWLATKLGITALVVIVCTAALSAAFGWWWEPVKEQNTILGWTEVYAFNNTGPVPVALALFTVVGGVAIGMLLRRTLISMVVTFGFAVVVQVVWAYERLNLGQIITINTRKGIADDAAVALPEGAYEVDRWFLSASGQTHGWGTCAKLELSEKACVQKYDLVGWSVGVPAHAADEQHAVVRGLDPLRPDRGRGGLRPHPSPQAHRLIPTRRSPRRAPVGPSPARTRLATRAGPRVPETHHPRSGERTPGNPGTEALPLVHARPSSRAAAYT